MSRQVRMVAKDWEHPKDRYGVHIPLDEGYASDADEFMAKANAEGLQSAIDWFGQAPDQEKYMPDWPEDERTHLMMYETTSEGTPISPAFETPEELARWLADNGASAFGNDTATYEQWLRVCRGGYAPTAVYSPAAGLQSGVAALADVSP